MQQPAVGKMRVTGDVLVRRPRGGQRQDHPPCRCPGSVHARRRGALPKARERSRDTTGTKSVSRRVCEKLLFSVLILTRNNRRSGTCASYLKLKTLQ